MKKKDATKETRLRFFITDFTVEVYRLDRCSKKYDDDYNQAWLRLWKRIDTLKLFN
jgi:hypothetical protein